MNSPTRPANPRGAASSGTVEPALAEVRPGRPAVGAEAAGGSIACATVIQSPLFVHDKPTVCEPEEVTSAYSHAPDGAVVTVVDVPSVYPVPCVQAPEAVVENVAPIITSLESLVVNVTVDALPAVVPPLAKCAEPSIPKPPSLMAIANTILPPLVALLANEMLSPESATEAVLYQHVSSPWFVVIELVPSDVQVRAVGVVAEMVWVRPVSMVYSQANMRSGLLVVEMVRVVDAVPVATSLMP